MSIASICVLISCLVLTGSASLLTLNVAKVVDDVGAENETKVFLDMGVSDVEAAYIGKDIEKIENISSVTFYSGQEAINQYKDMVGDTLFENIKDDDDVLPHAYHITMIDLSLYDETVNEIMQIEGVDTVGDRKELARTLTDLNQLVSAISIAVIIALTVISLFIVSNTIRVTMYSRRFEISIMKSVGATNAFVRIPFIVEGMLIGLISAIVSTFALYFLYTAIMDAITSMIPFVYIPISNLILYVGVAFVIAGMSIGAIGGFISMRKYLKKEGNEILGW
jgi:cell division transport system permease protein